LQSGSSRQTLAEGARFISLHAVTVIITVQLLAVIVLAVCRFIYLAARKRKSWARWILVAWQALNVASIHLNESLPELALDVIAVVLGMVGLYFAFTGDAKEWFKPAQMT
jgi:hypothetical protein